MNADDVEIVTASCVNFMDSWSNDIFSRTMANAIHKKSAVTNGILSLLCDNLITSGGGKKLLSHICVPTYSSTNWKQDHFSFQYRVTKAKYEVLRSTSRECDVTTEWRALLGSGLASFLSCSFLSLSLLCFFLSLLACCLLLQPMPPQCLFIIQFSFNSDAKRSSSKLNECIEREIKFFFRCLCKEIVLKSLAICFIYFKSFLLKSFQKEVISES